MPQWKFLIFFFFFFFFCNSTYSLYPEHWIMKEPVYVLHLITCHGRIMPRLAELLFQTAHKTLKWMIVCILLILTLVMLNKLRATYSLNFKPCHAEWIKMPRPLLIFSQSDYPTQAVHTKKVKENSRECHNHKPQPFPDTKRKRKPTNPNKHKSNKRTKGTKICSLFPKRGNRNTKRTEKHKNKMTHGKTYNKSPCRINHKVNKSKTNTGTTALERSVE